MAQGRKLKQVTDRDAQAISRLAVPALESLDADSRALVEAHGGENWLRALAVSPLLLKRFLQYYGDLFNGCHGRLPLVERELIGVVVSVHNGCSYCELVHTQGLGRALGDPLRARRIAMDHHLVAFSAREQALIDLALKVTAAPKTVNADDFAGLRALDLDDEEIAEAIEVAAWFNHTNRIAISFGIVPDADLFAL